MTMKVLTLNIWHNSGPWERRRELIGDWVRRLDPDLVGFQEVLRGPGIDQLADLAPEGFHTDFASAIPFWLDGDIEFGNAVCSRWPINDREVLELPDNEDGECRVALSVTIDAPFGEVSFTCTHLNYKPHHGMVRERQVVALCDLVLRRRPRGEHPFPPILVGDFNAGPDTTEIRYVTGRHAIDGRSVCLYDAWAVAGDGGPGHTWDNLNDYARQTLEPDMRIDYVFAGYPARVGDRYGLGRIERCEVVCDRSRDGLWPTDHLGVLAGLRTEPLER